MGSNTMAPGIWSTADLLALGYNLPLNASDQLLLGEVQLFDQLKQDGGLQVLCCPGLQYDIDPWVEQPDTGQKFEFIFTLSPPNAPGSGTEQQIGSFTVPVGYDGVIRSAVFAYNDTAYTPIAGPVTWRLKRNLVWVPNVGGNTALGSLNFPYDVGMIKLISQQVVSAWVNINTAFTPAQGGVSQLVIGLFGWFYPRY